MKWLVMVTYGEKMTGYIVINVIIISPLSIWSAIIIINITTTININITVIIISSLLHLVRHPSFLARQLMYGRPPLHWNFIITHTPHTLILVSLIVIDCAIATSIFIFLNLVVGIDTTIAIVMVVLAFIIIVVFFFTKDLRAICVETKNPPTPIFQTSILRWETRICGN